MRLGGVFGGGPSEAARLRQMLAEEGERLHRQAAQKRREPIEARIHELQSRVLMHLNLSPDDEHAKFMIKLIAVTIEKMDEMDERDQRALDTPSPSG